MRKERQNLRLVSDRDESLLEGLVRNALDGIPTPLDWVYQQLGVPDPTSAWEIVQTAARGGTANPPIFAIAEIDSAVEVIGWNEIRRGDDRDELRRHLLRCYVTFVARRARDAFKDGRLEIFPLAIDAETKRRSG